MATLNARLARPLAALLALAVLASAIYVGYTLLTGGNKRHLTAYFPRVIGMYKGSAVDLMGVPIGSVTGVDPQGTRVKVGIDYDAKYKLPADVGLALVTPSVVSDRYVQFTSAYVGGPTLANDATIPQSRVQIPVELDKIFGSLNDLNIALGPKGANKNGALSRLIDIGASNLRGNGQDFHDTLKGVSQAVSALSDSRSSLFGTVTQLAKFNRTLANDDGGVRAVNGELNSVAAQLAGERKDLGAAFANLATALSVVQGFVADNRGQLAHDVSSLTTVSKGLISEKQAITEITDEAPAAVYNLIESVSLNTPNQKNFGVLRTRNTLLDPQTLLLCIVKGNLPSAQLPPIPGLPTLPTTAQCNGGAPPSNSSSNPATPTTPKASTPSGAPQLPTPSLPGFGNLLGGGLGGLLGGSATPSSPASPSAPTSPAPQQGTGGLLGGILGSAYQGDTSVGNTFGALLVAGAV